MACRASFSMCPLTRMGMRGERERWTDRESQRGASRVLAKGGQKSTEKERNLVPQSEKDGSVLHRLVFLEA